MAVFQYTALDAQGVEIKNEIEALSQKEAISKIRNMGYFPKLGADGRATLHPANGIIYVLKVGRETQQQLVLGQ